MLLPVRAVFSWARGRQILSTVGIAVWAAVVVVLGAALLAGHLLPLPDVGNAAALIALREAPERGRVLAVHVLYTDCRCSQGIAEHLLGTVRPAGVAEHVILVGTDEALTSRLRAKGFVVHASTPEVLAERYGVQGAPMLFVAGPDDVVRYRGGYTDRKQGPAPRDREAIAAAAMGRSIPGYPVFGCAVAERLKRDRTIVVGIP